MSFEYLNAILEKSRTADITDLLNLAFGAGKDANNVFELSNKLSSSMPMQRCLSILKRDNKCKALIDSRSEIQSYDISELLAHSPGSLGRTFAIVMNAMKYDINFYPKPIFFNQLESEADYVNYRVFATHDIHHILTGFALNSAGETGVISVSVAQFAFPGFAFVDISSLLANWLAAEIPYRDIGSEIEKTKTARYKLSCITKGLEIGDVASQLFAVDWQELMPVQLDEVRSHLNIEPITEGIMSWYSDPILAQALK